MRIQNYKRNRSIIHFTLFAFIAWNPHPHLTVAPKPAVACPQIVDGWVVVDVSMVAMQHS